jgi:hypothetical protein
MALDINTYDYTLLPRYKICGEFLNIKMTNQAL